MQKGIAMPPAEWNCGSQNYGRPGAALLVTQTGRRSANVSLSGSSETFVALSDESGHRIASDIVAAGTSSARLSWTRFEPLSLRASSVERGGCATHQSEWLDTWDLRVERFGSSNRGANHDEDPSAAERVLYTPALTVGATDYATRTARVHVRRGAAVSMLYLTDDHRRIFGFASFASAAAQGAFYEATWSFADAGAVRRLQLCAAVRNALVCTEQSLAPLHVAALLARPAVPCVGCLQARWAPRGGGAASDDAADAPLHAVVRRSTATDLFPGCEASALFVIEDGAESAPTTPPEPGSGSGQATDPLWGYTDGDVLAMTLPTRGGHAAAYLACGEGGGEGGGPVFVQPIDIDGLWAERDAALLARTIPPPPFAPAPPLHSPLPPSPPHLTRDALDLVRERDLALVRSHAITRLLSFVVFVGSMATTIFLILDDPPRRRRRHRHHRQDHATDTAQVEIRGRGPHRPPPRPPRPPRPRVPRRRDAPLLPGHARASDAPDAGSSTTTRERSDEQGGVELEELPPVTVHEPPVNVHEAV